MKITVPEGQKVFGYDPEAKKHRMFEAGEEVTVAGKAQAEKISAILEKDDAPAAPAKVVAPKPAKVVAPKK